MTGSDLGDRHHVHNVVEFAVAPLREPEDLVASRGDFDRGGSILGGEVVPVGKMADVADVADYGGGHIGPHAENLSDARARRFARHLEALFVLPHLGVDAAQERKWAKWEPSCGPL